MYGIGGGTCPGAGLGLGACARSLLGEPLLFAGVEGAARTGGSALDDCRFGGELETVTFAAGVLEGDGEGVDLAEFRASSLEPLEEAAATGGSALAELSLIVGVDEGPPSRAKRFKRI